MSYCLPVKKDVRFFTFIAIFIASCMIVGTCSTEAEAKKNLSKSDSKEIAGQQSSVREVAYVGQIRKQSSIVSVKLTVSRPLVEGQKGAVLSYGGKRQCTCTGTYEGEYDNKITFSLLSENGGYFCDKCSRIEVTQPSENGDTLWYTVFLSDETTEQGFLIKMAK